MLKFKLLFGKNKLEFTDIDVALRMAFALSEKFNVHMIVYDDDEVVKIVMIKEEWELMLMAQGILLIIAIKVILDNNYIISGNIINNQLSNKR